MCAYIYFDAETKPLLNKLYNKSFRKETTDTIESYTEATVIPPTYYLEGVSHLEYGIMDENNNYIISSGKYYEECNRFNVPENIKYDDREVLYCGNLSIHYGHFLLETTPRLSFYLKNRDKYRHICFSAFNQEMPSYAKEFFDLLKIPLSDIILCDTYTKFKKVVLSPCSYYHRKYFNDDFTYPFVEAAKNITPAKYKKIYFTRKYWNNMAKCFGEEDLEKVFNKNGFHSVAMERLTLKEQIAVIKGAEVIAGINGTAFHNILFSDQQKTVIILNRNEEADDQYMINEATGVRCYLIKAYENPLPVYHPRGPFVVGITRHVQDFFNDYGIKNYKTGCFPKSKHIKNFLKQYALNYSVGNTYEELQYLHKDKIDAKDLILIIKLLHFSKLQSCLFYILSKLTFGKTRKSFKQKYKNLKSIINDKFNFRY